MLQTNQCLSSQSQLDTDWSAFSIDEIRCFSDPINSSQYLHEKERIGFPAVLVATILDWLNTISSHYLVLASKKAVALTGSFAGRRKNQRNQKTRGDKITCRENSIGSWNFLHQYLLSKILF